MHGDFIALFVCPLACLDFENKTLSSLQTFEIGRTTEVGIASCGGCVHYETSERDVKKDARVFFRILHVVSEDLVRSDMVLLWP